MKTKLFVGNLAPDVTEADLRETYAVFPGMEEVRLVLDRTTGKSRGYGFVSFTSGMEAQKAIAGTDRKPLKGRPLLLNEALAPEEWYEEPMRDLGLSPSQWDIVTAYQKLLTERRLIGPNDNPLLQAFLMYAVTCGRLPHLEKVIAAGANPNLVFPRGETPLGLVANWPEPDNAKGSRAEAVRALLKAGANPSQPSEGQTPMAIAIKYHRSDVIELLLDIVDKGKLGRSDLNAALFAAAGTGSLSLLKRLLAAGVPADPPSFSEGAAITPLTAATLSGKREIIEALLAAGADVNRTDLEGHTALDYALHNRSMARKAIPILKQAGAIEGRPFETEDKATEGFTAASKKPAFKQALTKLRKLTGSARKHLQGAEEEIAGGFGFAVREAEARTLVEQLQPELLAEGIFIFFSRELIGVNGPVVALLPTNDVYRVIAAVGTEGPNSRVSNQDLIAWVRKLEKEQPFVVYGLGSDFLEGKFTTPIADPLAVVRRINELCPDEVGPETEPQQVQHLTRTNRLFLWWD